ncbi:MAG: ATP-binding protein [Promethearchaeota archaeon]
MAEIYDALILGKVNPFRSTSVGDPWQAEVIDVPEINRKASRVVLETLDEVRSTGRSGMCMILGDAGVGKTHVLSRLRRIAEEWDYLFVSIRPLGDLQRIYGHILQEIMISLRKKGIEENYSPLERFIGEIVLRALSDGLSNNPAANDLLNSFIHDPVKIFTFELERFYSSDLRKLAIDYLASVHPDIDIQFLEVLFHTLNPDIRPTAFKWLSGIEISETDLALLDVPSSISTENRALSILQTISALAQKPILLSFDQLESIYIRFKRDNGIQLLFDSLTNLYNQCTHLLVLAMVQSVVWNESIQNEVPEYSRQRIDYITSLERLTSENAVLLAKARLETVFRDSGVSPPFPTYPFSENYIAIANRNANGNPRLFLRHLRDRLNEFKDRGRIYKLSEAEIHEEDKKTAVAVAGVPPMTPDKVLASAELSEESTKAIIDLKPEEMDALEELFPDINKPVPESIPYPLPMTPAPSMTPSVTDLLESLESSTISPPISTSSEVIGFLERKWAQYAREFEQEIFAFPHPVRRDFLKGVLYEILNASIERQRPLYGLTILNVRIDRQLIERDTKGLDLVFTYQTPRGPTSVGIEINNSEHSATVFQSLRRLKKLVKGNIRYAFILRDEELSLQRTATKTLDLAESLTEHGGLFYIDFMSNQALLATKKLIEFASAGDLTLGSHTISRNEALTFVFEECLNRIIIFQTIFSHLSTSESSTRSGSADRVSESSEAIEAIISILKFNPNMTTDRLCLLLNRNENEIVPVLRMLSIRGMISFDGKNIQLL